MTSPHKSYFFGRITTGLLFMLALVAPLFAVASLDSSIKAAPDDSKSDVVELPRYVVTGDRILPPPESWRYSTLPGYEILSNASTRATRRFLKDFQQLQEALHIVWPTLINREINVPTLIILCGRGNSFRPFVENAGDDGVFITQSSLFVEDKERGAIVFDFFLQEMTELGTPSSTNDPSSTELASDDFGESPAISTGAPDSASSMPAIDPYNGFYRQYARFLMRRANNNKPLPPWLEEGLARLFATLDVRKKAIEFGYVEEFARTVLYEDPFKPDSKIVVPFPYLESLDKIISYDPESEQPRPIEWSRASFAFVHMCLYGYQKKYQKAFLKFSQRAMAGSVTEDDYRECFGRTSKQMTAMLRSYVNTDSHDSILFKAKKGTEGLPDSPPIEIREATQAEIGRIKGDALRLANNAAASREALIVPYLRKEHDAGLLASLGLLEALEQRNARARRFLEAAAKENVVRPRAYAELARLRLEEVLASPAGADGKLNVAQTASVLEPLFTARGQPPPIEDVYSLIGSTWLCSETKPSKSHLGVLLEGTALFPRNVDILEKTATLYTFHGDANTAATLANLGARIAPNLQMRERFEALLSVLGKPSPFASLTGAN